MAHGSKLDGEIFADLLKDLTNSFSQAQIISAKLQNKDISYVIDLKDIDEILPGKYHEQMMKARVGQYFFRMTVLKLYNYRCCITGLMWSDLLIASYIKPWKVSDEPTEKTNLHDKAFDRGLITLNMNYRIIICGRLREA